MMNKKWLMVLFLSLFQANYSMSVDSVKNFIRHSPYKAALISVLGGIIGVAAFVIKSECDSVRREQLERDFVSLKRFYERVWFLENLPLKIAYIQEQYHDHLFPLVEFVSQMQLVRTCAHYKFLKDEWANFIYDLCDLKIQIVGSREYQTELHAKQKDEESEKQQSLYVALR